MVDKASNIWRDFDTDGVPASGKHKPVKAKIREWGTWVEGLVSEAGDLLTAYGAVGGGTINDQTAIDLLESEVVAEDVDLFGRTYRVTTLPELNHYYNGSFTDGTTVWHMPKLRKAHPLDGANVLIDQPADFNFTGPIWYDAAESRWNRVRMIGSTHNPADGMMPIYEYAEDGGAVYKGNRSIGGRSDAAISGITGIPMGSGRVGLLFAEVVSGTRTWYFQYSDDNGVTWSAPTSIGITGLFPYGPMYPWPASAGGHDTLGYITYAYSGGQLYYVRTADNGANWTSGVLFDGRSTGTATAGTTNTITVNPANVNANFYSDASLLINVNISITGGTGSGQTRRIQIANLSTGVITVQANWSTTPDATSVWSIEGPTELAVARVNSEAKWVIFARGASNFVSHTTTNMTSVTGAWNDTGIADRGQTAGVGLVGDSPAAFTKWGRIYLLIPRRENWTGDTGNENQLMVWEQKATTLYDAGGVFTMATGRRWMSLPDRPTSLPFFAEGPDGIRMIMRVGETTYDTNSDQATRNFLMTIGMGLPPQLPQRDEANWVDNASFDLAGRGTSFTGVTTNQTPIIERLKLNCSGATFDVSQVDVDENLSRMLPHRPSKAMLLDSTAVSSDFSGFEQVHYGASALHRFADKFVAAQIYGKGAPPALVRLVIFFDYGTAGSADTNEAELFTTPVVRTGGNGLWWATCLTPTPTLKSKTVDQTDCKVTFRIDNSSGTDAWDCEILGWDIREGEYVSRMNPVDIQAEKIKARRFLRVFGADSGYIAPVYRESTTQALGVVEYGMEIEPTLSLVGSASNLKINNVSTTLDATSVAFANVTKSAALVQIGHTSTTAYNSGLLYSTADTAYILADAEA